MPQQGGGEMKTLNELLDLAKQGKLDELDRLAAEAQGWQEKYGYGRNFWSDGGTKRQPNVVMNVSDYHPTRDKAQAWDLMVKGDLAPQKMTNGEWLVELVDGEFEHTDPLIAVTIAFIIAMQGDSNE